MKIPLEKSEEGKPTEQCKDMQSAETGGALAQDSAVAAVKPRGREVFFCVICVLFSVFLLLFAAVETATQMSDAVWAQWTPTYGKSDLTGILSKNAAEWTEEDYAEIYAQTGLTKIGADRLLESGQVEKIKSIQESYFLPREVKRDRFAPWTCWEKVNKAAEFGAVRAGDIIVTSATHVLGFRYGHAALIVSDGGAIVEANTPGTKSHRTALSVFDNYATFMILRPDPQKISDEMRLSIAKYAEENLLGIDYTVFAGIFSKKNQQPLKGTQCAHLVWYAYMQFGYDLDSNGGPIVKPQDMANSEYLQVVQVYGFDPETLWR